MLAAALRTDGEAKTEGAHTHTPTTTAAYLNMQTSLQIPFLVSTDDYKEFSTNCESMAAEIEDHIL